jgi:hypothetical protein
MAVLARETFSDNFPASARGFGEAMGEVRIPKLDKSIAVDSPATVPTLGDERTGLLGDGLKVGDDGGLGFGVGVGVAVGDGDGEAAGVGLGLGLGLGEGVGLALPCDGDPTIQLVLPKGLRYTLLSLVTEPNEY